MCPRAGEHPRRRRAAAASILGACLVLRAAGPGPAWASVRADDDPVIAYLEQHGLTDLVVARLEARFREALGDDRIPIAERLAVLYGRLLDETDDDRERAVWERRSREMLDQVPRANTETLRLTIHKASYLRAERLAELHRLRRASEPERATAVRLMSEAAAVMSESHAHVRERVRRLEAAEVSRSDLESGLIDEQLADLEQMAAQSAYYAGWARYYQAWLTNSTAGLDEALRLLGRLLQFDGALPTPEETPDSVLVGEASARAAIGIALCQAQAGRPQTGLAWLDLVEAANPQSQRLGAILPGYRLVLLFAARQWSTIDSLVNQWRTDQALTVTLVRLLAVLALEQSQLTGEESARRLGEKAVNLLAEMGELRQVIEIADVFRLDTLGGDSFILAYVPAIKAYERAREAHGLEEPAKDPIHLALYKGAEEQLAATVGRRDADQWPDATRNARLLIAWSRYFQNRLEPAAVLFEEIARQTSGDESEAAMWMHIVCREKQAAGGSPSSVANLRRALESFLERYPSSSRAGRVRLRLTVTKSSTPSHESVDELLSIPAGSDAYGAARHEAERLLYLLFREASAASRIQTAQRYLDVALPLLEGDERRAFIAGGDAAVREQYLLRARRVLDVLLARGVARVSEARHILDRLDTARAAGLINLDAIADELDYRRFQAQILSGGFEEAARSCDELWRADPDSAFAQSACRALYTYAVQDWQTFAEGGRLEETLRRVVLYGRRALRAAGDPPDASAPANAAIMINVADAALSIDRMASGGDAEARALAERWFDLLIAAQPRIYRVLRGAAMIAENRRDTALAIDHWRTAMTGSPESSAEWFEAKFNFLRLLAEAEPGRAAEVLRQHALLYPQYGPEPWGERLRALHNRVGRGGDR